MDAKQDEFDNQMELLGKVGHALENFTDEIKSLLEEGLTEDKFLPRRLQNRLTSLLEEALALS